IAFMREHHTQQPNLSAIAQHLNLSEHHFQKLFTQWAGISPKRFSQYLSVEYAKSKIAHAPNLLDLATETGLSSPGRLHDLFVTLEALSPGEYKTGGAGLEICYGVHDTPFGEALIATTNRGICNLYFLAIAQNHPAQTPNEQAEQILLKQWPAAKITFDNAMTRPLCDRIFAPLTHPAQKPLTLLVKGTNFQIQVWRALLRVPFGEMATYQTIAEIIGKPTAARAVGTAIGSNPIGYLIPCHRVIRASGALGGYLWGLERKVAMLGWEASQISLAHSSAHSLAQSLAHQPSSATDAAIDDTAEAAAEALTECVPLLQIGLGPHPKSLSLREKDLNLAPFSFGRRAGDEGSLT
ncbi:MAG: methylated-DNA--[protein]-cysteine S-methyltransferase, partial [Phormidesmis sp.]